VDGVRRQLAAAAGAVGQGGKGDGHRGIWSRTTVPQRSYTAEEVDAAVGRLTEPGRLRHAQEVVTHAAPSLQRLLNDALEEGGFFGEAHEGEVGKAVREADEAERARRVRTLVAEETRLGMLVGVAVGFELAHELMTDPDEESQ
jgi:hypothetical protein